MLLFSALITTSLARPPASEGPRRGGTANQYGVLPIPRIWGFVGLTTQGFEPAVGASIGAGSTFVVFGEWTGGPETVGFYGIGTHSFIGDSYSHVTAPMTLAGSDRPARLHCRVLHRHYVRPGLLMGVLREEGATGARIRPEVSFGSFGNLVVSAPVSWVDGRGFRAGLQVGAALGFP